MAEVGTRRNHSCAENGRSNRLGTRFSFRSWEVPVSTARRSLLHTTGGHASGGAFCRRMLSSVAQLRKPTTMAPTSHSSASGVLAIVVPRPKGLVAGNHLSLASSQSIVRDGPGVGSGSESRYRSGTVLTRCVQPRRRKSLFSSMQPQFQRIRHAVSEPMHRLQS